MKNYNRCKKHCKEHETLTYETPASETPASEICINELSIGTHLSVAKGYAALAKDAVQIGANTFQMFIRNPRGARAKELKPGEIETFLDILQMHGFGPFIAHAPYTLNLCSSSRHLRELSARMMGEDLQRMELMPGNLYNLHPGSRLDQPLDSAIEQIAQGLNHVMFPDMKTTVLLETMSGKGSEVGKRFEELKEILDRVAQKDHIGVCMDACHMWDSGYDIVDRLDEMLEQFDRLIGLNRLKAFHINDSMNVRESHKDRHTLIGEGHIGEDTIIRIINHPRLCHLPFILETPTDLAGHAQEIKKLRKQYVWGSVSDKISEQNGISKTYPGADF